MLHFFKNIRFALFENWHIKVGCICLACLIFLFFHLTIFQQKTLSIPIFVTTHPSMIVSQLSQTHANVIVRAKSNVIHSFKQNSFHLNIYAQDISSSGLYSLPIILSFDDSISSPFQPKLKTHFASVFLEPLISKQVPIKPAWLNPLNKNFKLESFSFSPPSVSIIGPASTLNTIDFIQSKPIALADKQSDFSYHLDLVPPKLTSINSQNSSILFSAKIYPIPKSITLNNLNITAINIPNGLFFKPIDIPWIQIFVNNPQGISDNIQHNFQQQFSLLVDLASLSFSNTDLQNIKQRPLSFSLPVSLIVKPSRFDYSYEYGPSVLRFTLSSSLNTSSPNNSSPNNPSPNTSSPNNPSLNNPSLNTSSSNNPSPSTSSNVAFNTNSISFLSYSLLSSYLAFNKDFIV